MCSPKSVSFLGNFVENPVCIKRTEIKSIYHKVFTFRYFLGRFISRSISKVFKVNIDDHANSSFINFLKRKIPTRITVFSWLNLKTQINLIHDSRFLTRKNLIFSFAYLSNLNVVVNQLSIWTSKQNYCFRILLIKN